MDHIQLAVDAGIATVTLARPPVNALSAEMIGELVDLLRRLDADDAVRAVVLTGAGRCFSAGVDLKQQLAAMEQGEPGPGGLGSSLYAALLHGAKPTIAALNGPALGAGFGIAASCCILVAAETAEVGLPEIDVGLLGGARHAMRLLGHSTVNRMLLTGHRLDARELARRGVVEACLPAAELMPFALGIAAEIAARDPLALQLVRRSLVDVETMSVLDGYAHEAGLAAQLAASPTASRLMRAFVGDRSR